MHGLRKIGWPAALSWRAVVPLLMLAVTVALAVPAAASRPAEVIVLPGAKSAEGIAAGRGATFFAGDLFGGDIFRGNFRRGTAELFIDVPEGRNAVGMAVDRAGRLLFVAGGFTGQAYVYDTRTKATVATYQFGNPQTSVINDVAVTRRGAWFTDSKQATLYFVPKSRAGVSTQFRTLALSGPAADTSGEFNLNGIQATASGKTLIVAHSANAKLYTVDPRPAQAPLSPASACPPSTASCCRAGGCGRCRTQPRDAGPAGPPPSPGAVRGSSRATCSSCRAPPPVTAGGSGSSTRSSTRVSLRPQTATRWSSSAGERASAAVATVSVRARSGRHLGVCPPLRRPPDGMSRTDDWEHSADRSRAWHGGCATPTANGSPGWRTHSQARVDPCGNFDFKGGEPDLITQQLARKREPAREFVHPGNRGFEPSTSTHGAGVSGTVGACDHDRCRCGWHAGGAQWAGSPWPG